MTAARSRVATGTAGSAGGPCEAVGFGVLPAGHQPRGERGPVVVEDDAAGAAQVSLRVTTASAAAHSPGAHAATARRAGAGCCARGRGHDVLTGHADIMGTTAARTPISDRESPRCGPESDRMPGTEAPQPGEKRRMPRGGGRHTRDGGVCGPGTQRTPRTPTRAHLPLLPSGPGGVRRDDAARGVCTHPSPGRCRARNPLHRAPRRAPGRRLSEAIRPGRRRPGLLVALLSVRIRASPTVARRIRLVAYGARLESVLG